MSVQSVKPKQVYMDSVYIKAHLTEWPTISTYILPQLITNGLVTMYLCHFISSHTILNGSCVGVVPQF